MDATTIIAWIGALTGTTALLWDFYKWKTSGPKLRVTVLTRMTIRQPGTPLHNQKVILVKVANIGSSKTTITTLAFQFYETRHKRLTNKTAYQSIVPNPGPTLGRLPHVLDAGEEWSATVEYDEEIISMARRGYLYCSVFHTLSKKPVDERVTVAYDAEKKASATTK